VKILGIDHVAIATDDIDRDAPFWKYILGINHSGREDVPQEGVTTDIYDTGRGKIELLADFGENSPIKEYLEKRGKGIHHVSLQVDNINVATAELKEKGIRLISDEPKVGAEGYEIIFIHPESTGGVLVELAEKPE
jgi:methylmalonyl-CoA/ethylmalonyl-CoA epimerase